MLFFHRELREIQAAFFVILQNKITIKYSPFFDREEKKEAIFNVFSQNKVTFEMYDFTQARVHQFHLWQLRFPDGLISSLCLHFFGDCRSHVSCDAQENNFKAQGIVLFRHNGQFKTYFHKSFCLLFMTHINEKHALYAPLRCSQ